MNATPNIVSICRALWLAILLCVPAGPVLGQTRLDTISGQERLAPRGRIGVSVEILQALSIRGINNLSFGRIAATASGSVTRVQKTSPDAGMFEVVGSDNQQIQVRYTAPSELIATGGGGSLPIQLDLYGTQSQENTNSARRLIQNETVSLSDGRYYFIVGGMLRVGSLLDNPPGRYVGEFEIETSYTDL